MIYTNSPDFLTKRKRTNILICSIQVIHDREG